MPIKYLYEHPAIREGLVHLLKKDPVFKTLPTKPEDLLWAYTPPGYASLVRIIIGQQLSTSAARSVWEKFKVSVRVVKPETILKLEDDALRALGLSGQKVKYIRGLSTAITDGTFNPRALAALPDESVTAAITALNGFGPWSAQMYLMFSLARPNIWPPGDLGIQEGLRVYLRKKTRPTMEQTLAAKKRFTPHCTAAALLLWHLKALDEQAKKGKKK